MTVIDDIVPLSESANRQRVLAIVLKDHSSAPLILESTHEEYKSALADLRQLGLDLGASAIVKIKNDHDRHEEDGRLE